MWIMRSCCDMPGTTSRGIGPAYGDKFRRAGMRVADLLLPDRYEALLQSNIAAWNAILDKAGMDAVDVASVIEETRAIGERLRPYVADAELRDAAGAAGAARTTTTFTADRMARDTEALIERLLHRE